MDAKEALGKHESFESFLCECLDIEKQDAYELVRRHPRLSGRSVSMVDIPICKFKIIAFPKYLIPFSGERNSRIFDKRNRVHEKRYCIDTIGPILWFGDNQDTRR